MDKEYYIYAHWTADTKELFYIGASSDKYRMTNKTHRNQVWKDIVSKQGFTVEVIIDGFMTRNEVVEEEVRLQKLNKPRACLAYGEGRHKVFSEYSRYKMSKARLKKVVNCRGQIFESIGQAASAFNMKSQGNICDNIKGRRATAGKYSNGTRIVWDFI